MIVRLRSFGGQHNFTIDDLSKTTTIKSLKERTVKMGLLTGEINLLYQGKFMKDSHTLHEYNVQNNAIISFVIKKEPKVQNNSEDEDNKDTNKKTEENQEKYYSNRDLLVALDMKVGVWRAVEVINSRKSEDKIKTIHYPYKYTPAEFITSLEDNFLYDVKYRCAECVSNDLKNNENRCDDCLHDEIIENLSLALLKPHPRRKYSIENLNKDDPVVIKSSDLTKTGKNDEYFECSVLQSTSRNVIVEVLAAKSANLKSKITLKTTVDFYLPEYPGDQCNLDNPEHMVSFYEGTYNCEKCKDHPRKSCLDCHCKNCGSKKDLDLQIMCDECDDTYHIYCINPPLENIPTENWYCENCKNDDIDIVKDGDKLQESKKKSKMPAATSKSKRDWGRGFATVGRDKECTIVPKNHFGPIPGVDVGMSWRFRKQASEVGVHRPMVSGIHGQSNVGAFSIVLAGGYEDDIDYGHEFIFTGSGGRDLSGNKRQAEQSKDQQLNLNNMSLARNCAIDLSESGGDAKDNWRLGKPVRVLRSYKLAKHSKFAPPEGVRYDGIYKIVKYWKAVGQAGFAVWRYLFRRDDTIPAPWTTEGKNRIKELGYKMEEPENYTPDYNSGRSTAGCGNSSKNKRRSSSSKKSNRKDYSSDETTTDEDDDELILDDSPDAKKKINSFKVKIDNKKTGRRILNKGKENFSSDEDDYKPNKDDDGYSKKVNMPLQKVSRMTRSQSNDSSNNISINSDDEPPKKRLRGSNKENKCLSLEVAIEKKIISSNLAEFIKLDDDNSKKWTEVFQKSRNKKELLENGMETFSCFICQNLLYEPVTPACKHSVCLRCLKNSISKDKKECSACRQILDDTMNVNDSLAECLRILYPAYGIDL